MAGRPILRRTCAQPVLFRALPETEIPRALHVDVYLCDGPKMSQKAGASAENPGFLAFLGWIPFGFARPKGKIGRKRKALLVEKI